MSQTEISKVGKKRAIYIPKHICEQLGVKENDKVLMKVEDGRLILEFIPVSLAMKIKRWAKTTVEFEKESEEEQNEFHNA